MITIIVLIALVFIICDLKYGAGSSIYHNGGPG